MKLSKSKLALAKVINENGGWVDGAEYAAQDKCAQVTMFKSKPIRHGNTWLDDEGFDDVGGFGCDKIQNWHQTILSREEYYQAYPEADADGWIEWSGGECPVEKGTLVDVKYSGGEVRIGMAAMIPVSKCYGVTGPYWRHDGGKGDIIAYRLHKPEVKPEFCESVTRSIPEPEAKPTIEQLAQDYRNAKDYADMLQKEAGEAAVKAESFAVEIRKKILEMQELIKTSKPEQEPELVIADWRDLQKGDIIWWSGDSKYSSGEYPVHDIEEHCHTGSCAILLDVGYCCRQWIDHDDEDWKFIRRP